MDETPEYLEQVNNHQDSKQLLTNLLWDTQQVTGTTGSDRLEEELRLNAFSSTSMSD